jgi:hypothetical protein
VSDEYLRSLFDTACKNFDKDYAVKHSGKVRVTIGLCPKHFTQRVSERIPDDKSKLLREEIVCAAIRYIDFKYDYFSNLTEKTACGVKYKGYQIRYKCRPRMFDGEKIGVEVIPVTVF